MKRTLLMMMLGGLICGLASCGDDSRPPPAEPPRLLLYCGAGIQPPVADLIHAFAMDTGTAVEVDYAGSETLLSRLKLSRKGDLYMPGDKHYVDQAAEAGLIQDRKSVCYFVPTILVAKGNPKGITGVADLLNDRVKFGLGDAQACAIGRISRQIFEKNGIPWDKVAEKVAFQSLTVNELGSQIKVGSLDAVIVWDAIARYYEGAGEAVVIPTEKNVISTVDLGVLSFSEQQERAARFVDYVTSPQGQRIFARHHYQIEPPSSRPVSE